MGEARHLTWKPRRIQTRQEKGDNKKKAPVDAREELIDQIVEEVRERREFLETMSAAGKGSQYEGIKVEIAARLVELERMGLDTKSSFLDKGRKQHHSSLLHLS
jgi:hypothetical protein